MKNVVVFLLALFSLSFILPACSNASSATMGQSITLHPSQVVTINGEDLKIEFVSVTEDSRCPTGAT
jgi:hypothetical protein